MNVQFGVVVGHGRAMCRVHDLQEARLKITPELHNFYL